MSLQRRYLPTPSQAGPSAQSIPVANRWIGVLPILYFAKRLSRTMMSGSGYRVGDFPDQSRGVSANAFGRTSAPAAASPADFKSARRFGMKTDSLIATTPWWKRTDPLHHTHRD